MSTLDMSEAAFAALKQFNDTTNDWTAQCPACKGERMGTLKHLTTEPCEHCGVVSGSDS